MALVGRVRAKVGQVQGVRVQTSRRAGTKGGRARPRQASPRSPKKPAGILQCPTRTKAGYWEDEIP